VDGKYGPKTAAAVKVFQSGHSLPPTGTVDAATWSALKSPGNVLSSKTQKFLDWIVGDTKDLDPLDKLTSSWWSNAPQDLAAQKSNHHLYLWLGGGAVAVSVLAVAMANHGDKD
jgi:hypothetical protein